ncbi:Hypothetical predicted protein [Pelobates cultripes]|uniref:PH domain-containing protein n=1 Tax=Pelobates cultripes TaxID=61616 RepID=A0AAD1S399_PELCU|nr:Hypothetical predicted protein [Pelobates cultripes]
MAENKPQEPNRFSPKIEESVRESLSFEGFLRKRKDTMKFTWSKYWFKLQNTTLFFYIPGEVLTATLRGQYYMYNVLSVRKLTNSDIGFQFEIVMKNGKRKLLSADTAELRDVWMAFLWKAMQLPGPGRHNSSCTWYDIPGLLQRANSETMNDELNAISMQVDVPLTNQTDRHRDDEDGPQGVYEIPNFVAFNSPAKDTVSDSDDDADIYDVPRPINSQPVQVSGTETVASGTTDLYPTLLPKYHLTSNESGDPF